ncbi:MAG: hypothetical protein J7M10_02760 [Candidatus Cloacimonetes bacterium]|nr:hypothetical protein [Candidatus Cloacimonadota bacterium]
MKKNYFFLLLSVLLLIFSSCTIKKWDPPEWDVTLEIPVINKRVYMHELEDTTDTYIIRLDNDTLFFSMSEDIESKNVGDELKVDGKTETMDKEIGDELSMEDHQEIFTIEVGDSLKLDGRSDSFSTEIGDKLEIASRIENFSVEVGDSLKIPPQSRSFSNQLERIEVDETGNSDAIVYVLDFARSAIPGAGPIYNTPIPPIYNFPPFDTTFSVFENENIDYVVIDSGFAYIDFTNNSEIPLSSTNPNHYMILEIYSGAAPTLDDPIITHEIDHKIAAGETEQIELDLAGAQVYQDNYLRVILSTDGTGGQPIDVLETHNFYVTFRVSEMTVSEASAKLPAESIQHNDAISILDNDVQVVYAKISECFGNIKIDNYLPIDAKATIDFVELLDNTGSPLHIEFDIGQSPPSNIEELNLAGYEIVANNKAVLDSLHFSYNILTYPTTGFVQINTSQYVDCYIDFEKMWFENISGYVDQSFSKDDNFSIADDTGEIILEEALIRSGNLSIDLSGLSFSPEITIQFDEILVPPTYTQPLIITNSDFDNYNFANHKFVVTPDQLVHYHIDVQMPGQTEQITITNTDEVNATINLSEFIFEEVTGTLNNKSFEDDDAISIIDDTGEITLQYAKIKSAENSYVFFHNDFPYTMDGSVTFQELKLPSGLPYNFNFSIPSNDTYQQDLELANCTIESGKSVDSLHYSFDVTLNGTGSINYSDSVFAEFNLGEMYFEEVEGMIDKKFTKEGSISAEDSTITLQRAEIRSGNLVVDFSGIELESPTTVRLTIDEILTPPPYSVPVDIIISDNFSHFEYDFADHIIEPTADSLKLNYSAEVEIDQSISLSSSDVVTADILLSDLIFNSVTGKFNSMTIEDEKAVEVDSTGEYLLCFAEIDSCDVMVSIPEAHYTLPFGAQIEIVFEEIFDEFGDTLKIDLSCPGDTTFSFAGYSIGGDPFSTVPIDSLHYSYNVTTEATQGYETVYYEDEVRAEIEIGELLFSLIKGIIDHKQFKMDDIEEELDFADMPDSIANVMMFQNAELHLDVYNGTGFNCWLNIDMIGSNDEGDTVTIHIDEESGTIYPDQMNHIVVTEGVSEMLSIVPKRVQAISPYAIIGNGVSVGSITRQDSISGSYTLETPFKFIINDHTVQLDSLTHMEVDKDARDAIRDNLNGVTMNLTAENLLPFGSNIEINFAADSTEVWINPELVIDSFYVEPATIDPVHHTSGEVVVSNIEIELTHEHGDFSVFENPDVYVGFKMHLIGTGGEVVIIRGSDNLRVFGYVSVDVHVKEAGGEK